MIAIYGGSFDPIHIGHSAIIDAIQKELKPKKLLLIPAGIPPHKKACLFDAPTRLSLLKAASGKFKAEILDYEIHKNTPSYSIETLEWLEAQYPKDEFIFVIGSDSLEGLTSWHRAKDLARLVTFAVFLRAKTTLKQLAPIIKDLEKQGFKLKILKSKIPAVSSTDVRKSLENQQGWQELTPKETHNQLKTYLNQEPKNVKERATMESIVNLDVKKPRKTSAKKTAAQDSSTKELALLCPHAAIDKKALHSMIIKVGAKGSYTDYFLISSGSSEAQVQAMADEVVKHLKKNGVRPTVEGYDQGRWVLIDAGAVVCHLFHDDIRKFYNLEELWLGAPRLEIPADFYTTSLKA